MPSLSGLLALVLFQSPSTASPIPLLLLALSIVGAIEDSRYMKAGGRPASRRDKMIFLSLVVLVPGTIGVHAYLGYNPEILAMIIPLLALWLFFAWELGRWRMRRKYPLPKSEAGQSKPPEAAP
jgi:hypothetical protein